MLVFINVAIVQNGQAVRSDYFDRGQEYHFTVQIADHCDQPLNTFRGKIEHVLSSRGMPIQEFV